MAASRALPPRPSLDQLKKQAKELLAAVVRGDLDARERLERYFPAAPTETERPKAGGAGAPTLSQAQLVIAREYGFSSWAALREGVEVAPWRALLERAIERPIDWAARRNAMEALAAGGPSGMRVALDALSDPNPELRKAALGFIDHHATDACVPQLIHVAQHDPDPDIRRGALHALTCERCKPEPLGTDVQPVLLKLFREDANRRVRATASGSLLRSAGGDAPTVKEAFRAAVLDDPSALVRRSAVLYLRGDDALPLLARVAEHDVDALVRVTAARRLGREPYLQLACRVLEAAVRENASLQVTREAHLTLKRFSPEYRQRVAERAREANLAGEPIPPVRVRRRGGGRLAKAASGAERMEA